MLATSLSASEGRGPGSLRQWSEGADDAHNAEDIHIVYNARRVYGTVQV